VAACEWIGRDTCAEPELFYSNRHAFHRGDADYGRLLSAIMLEPQ
jgi:copper oxidase (laccase) domain-containing protein